MNNVSAQLNNALPMVTQLVVIAVVVTGEGDAPVLKTQQQTLCDGSM